MRLLRVLPLSTSCRALLYICTYYGEKVEALWQKRQVFGDNYGLWGSVAIVKSYDVLSDCPSSLSRIRFHLTGITCNPHFSYHFFYTIRFFKILPHKNSSFVT